MLTLSVYDKHFTRQGWVGAPRSATLVLAHNDIGSFDFSVASEHDMVEHLLAPGARLVVAHEGTDVFSGRIVGAKADGPSSDGEIAFVVQDDWALLEQMLGWPRPTSSIGNQGDDDTHWRYTGPVETALKNLVTANASRLGLPVVVAPTQGRGNHVTAAVRFRTPAEALVPTLDASGLGARVLQRNGQLEVDVYDTEAFPLTLDEQSGIVASWSWSQDGPSATRVVIGAGGEGEARHFARRIDTAREAEHGACLEVFRDARDVAVDDEDRDDILTERMIETLDDGAATAGLRVAFSQNEGFRFARDYNLGDTIRLRIGAAGIVEDRLREVTLTWVTPDYVSVDSAIGERIDNADTPDITILRAIRSMYRRVLRLETSS